MAKAELTLEIPKQATTEPGQQCLLCGSPLQCVLNQVADTRFGTPGSYEIRRCASCGHEQTWPAPSLEELKRLYEAQYNFGGESDTHYTRLRRRFLESFLYRLWIGVDGDISFHSKKGSGRLLDIGCNEGRGLRLYARNGFEVEGLELNAKAAAIARRTGFAVHTCLLENFQPAADYDVAVLSNVLEHAVDPARMLADVHRVLAYGGQVWISCPNAHSRQRELFGRSWINWHVPFHISHFSALSLRRLLDGAGFANAEISQISPALWVAQSFIAWRFARPGRKNGQLRNPFLTLLLVLCARFLLFPALWLANRSGHGDCLLAVATKS